MIATIRKLLTFAVCLLPALALAQSHTSAGTNPPADWRVRLNQQLQLMGHRNWIAVVDSAYPLQTSPGVETIETNDDQLQVVKTVLDQIAKAKHVRPVIFTDAELKLVPESDAKGVTSYREALSNLLSSIKSSTAAPGNPEAQSLPHEEIIAKLDEAGKTFHILILKTTLTISLYLSLHPARLRLLGSRRRATIARSDGGALRHPRLQARSYAIGRPISQ
jgi:hypothetical protein